MTSPHIPALIPAPAFVQRLSATRRGARLARLLAVHQLTEWGHPLGTEFSDRVALVVAELASNAVLHGRVAGRDFMLRLISDEEQGFVRIEVSDAHSGLPVRAAPGPDEDRGRGMVLVEALADRWGVGDRVGPGKTVWAECAHRPHPDAGGVEQEVRGVTNGAVRRRARTEGRHASYSPGPTGA
ncbi:ATP-binding protein [Streptomyces amakusaensis]|uniref:ATP-binding protein n=1 Tax=Streptomyces amakusaensis TaxID=67271 RepID=A0ABW0AKW2_9ACTN